MGTIVMVIGFIMAFLFSFRSFYINKDGKRAFTLLRTMIGSSILLGLEILVAADLLRTMLTPNLHDVTVLAIIVLIRTFLSISIEVEIDGVLPWKRAMMESGGTKIARTINSELSPAPVDSKTAQDTRAIVSGSFDSPVTRVQEHKVQAAEGRKQAANHEVKTLERDDVQTSNRGAKTQEPKGTQTPRKKAKRESYKPTHQEVDDYENNFSENNLYDY